MLAQAKCQPFSMTFQYWQAGMKKTRKEPRSQTLPSSSSILASAWALECEGSGRKNHANLNLKGPNKYSTNVPLRFTRSFSASTQAKCQPFSMTFQYWQAGMKKTRKEPHSQTQPSSSSIQPWLLHWHAKDLVESTIKVPSREGI